MEFQVKFFSEALKESRKKKKMTQTELADKVGISAMSISRYEAGDSIPDMGILASICVELDDDTLFYSWKYTKGHDKEENYPDHQRIQIAFTKAKEIAYRKYWDELVVNGTWKFQRRLVYLAQHLQNMNGKGFRKSLEIIEALSKVPDYQTDDKEWAFRPDSPEEATTDDESGTESE